jgi:pimeloyl-ACP methyl ester carboxylesterase
VINRNVETSHGTIALTQSAGNGLPVLMIHGNSSCKEVFRNQLEGDVGATYRCIAMDLPGHGSSQNARNPEKTYSMPGYADAALELMRELGHNNYAILGWSLGGHIGLEMLAHTANIRGLMISGTPPVGRGDEQLSAGFLFSEHMGLAGKRNLTEVEIDAYSRATCGVNAPFEQFLRDAVARTDGQARELMFESFRNGIGVNQREAALYSAVPLAIVNGGGEPFVNNDYVVSLPYENLWENKVHLMENIGHAPFWEAPNIFNPYLNRFLESL